MSASVGFCISDFEMNILEVDQRFEDILGLTGSKLKGRNVLDLTHEDDRSTNTCWLDRLRAGGAPFSITKRYRRDDGALIRVTNHVGILRDGWMQPRLFATVEASSSHGVEGKGRCGWLTASDLLQTQERASRTLGREIASGDPLSILVATYAAEEEGRVCDFAYLERATIISRKTLWRWLGLLRQWKLLEGEIPDNPEGEAHVQLTSDAFFKVTEVLTGNDRRQRISGV